MPGWPRFLLVLATAAAPAAAQVPSAVTVHGEVVETSGEAVPYAVVLLAPGFPQRFADERGTFAIAAVPPGRYRLLVRQVGFVAFDSAVTIDSAAAPLRVALRRVAVRLAPITVETAWRCRQPGPPDPAADPALVAVFDQLRLNAERHRLLLDQYPFHYAMSRQLADVRRGFEESSHTDTLVLRSDARWPYAPGRVVTDDPVEGRHGVRNVHIPVLADFADTAFQNSHCFHLAGLDTLEGRSVVRLDFRADELLRYPDVNGSAYLDPVSYQVLHTSVTLTRVNRAVGGVQAYVATATFRELRPNLIVVERMSALTTLAARAAPGAIVGRTELQRLIRVTFERALPAAADSSP